MSDRVHNHFHGMLLGCLADELDRDPRVFVDTGIDVGAHRPTRLASALHRSRLLLPVLSPPYFRSRRRLAEWSTMTARERHCGHVHDLLYPVVFRDGTHFPAEARHATSRRGRCRTRGTTGPRTSSRSTWRCARSPRTWASG
ncbi:hypothetical protein GCM10022243_02340 [Saccharothrix violaceirubra]